MHAWTRRDLLFAAIAAATALVSSRDGWTQGDDVRIADGASVALASVEEGRKVLEKLDDFILAMGPLERRILLEKDAPVSREDYAAFAGGQVLPWGARDEARVRDALGAIGKKIEGLRLPLPRLIRVIHTTGRESWGAAYTRGSAIVLPSAYTGGALERLLLHELFHVLTRNSPQLKRPLYGILGFENGLRVELPRDIDERRITNPDAPPVDCAIRLRSGDEELTAAPIIFSSRAGRDAAVPPRLQGYLEFKLLVIEERGGRWVPRSRDGAPWMLDAQAHPGYAAQVGRNTLYIIHPEEILAENFVHLVEGTKDLPDPGIVDALRKVLADARRPSRRVWI